MFVVHGLSWVYVICGRGDCTFDVFKIIVYLL